jgi:dihydrofolate reductase
MSLSEVLSGARLIGPSTRERNVHGSGNLAQTLIRHGLVDEYHLWFFPVVLGQGKRLFADGTVPATLRLVDSKVVEDRGLHGHLRAGRRGRDGLVLASRVEGNRE